MESAITIERQPISGLDLVPDRVKQSYLDTIATLNANIPSAVATLARRTLEGVVKLAYSDPSATRDKTLYKVIEGLPENANLDAPILALAHAMREGGNLGAHFDLDQETDQAMAVQMVELLENLIEYLYVIPHRVQRLKDSFT
ncbi:hypothetical protein GCM10022631_11830 [Deinococcus rubellus]